jgi:mono/diheme cytochrome c family protein
VNPADDVALAVFAHRDPETFEWLDEPRWRLPDAPVPLDVPPLWNVGHKTALYYMGSGRGDHARLMMSAAAFCTDDVEEARRIAERFADVRAYLATIEPPSFPGALDAELAEEGAPVFERFCAGCHGSPLDGWSEPTRLVPLREVGTDRLLAERGQLLAGAFAESYEASFYGEGTELVFTRGYVAPPLRGVWATAPYFHNGSVPTLDAVIDRDLRPRFFRRTFYSRDYDLERVGWRYEELDAGKDAAAPDERAAIYDTTRPGYGNHGHRYGDLLSRDERRAVLEYLKTL